MAHLFQRDDCISCPGTTPVCSCAANENCILTSRTCNTCAAIQCVPQSASGGSGGVNPGVIAGPVVAALAIATVAAFFWWRRRRNRDIRQVEAIRRATLKAEQAGFHLHSANAPGAAGPGTGNGEGFGLPVERGGGTRSPSLNARERADGASARFPREAGARGSFDALTFGSGTAEWSHLQRSPHGTLGQAGAQGGGGSGPGELGALGMTSRTYSGQSINLDPAHPSNLDRDRLLDGRDTSPTASFRLELERDRDRRRDADGLNPFSDRQSIATDALSFGSTNVIPIAFVPPSGAGEDRAGQTHGKAQDSAMALDAARRELANLRGGHPVGPPMRPHRSPDLDLRLNPGAASGRLPGTGLEFLGNAYDPRGGANDARQSFQTSRTIASIAPSFFSSQTDLNGDIPMILTSRQVQVGKREMAQEVQLDGHGGGSQPATGMRLGVDTGVHAAGPGSAGGMTRSPASFRSIASSTGSDPFDESKAVGGLQLPHGLQHATSHATFGDGGYDPALSERSVTPASQDLRFSMGSLAFRGDRDSVSTQGTGNVVMGEARKVFLGAGPQTARQTGSLHPPRAPFSQSTAGPRESMMSGRSDADSLLGSFPIIPPSPDGDENAFATPTLPTSMSSGSVLAPGVMVRPGGNANNMPSRPTSDTTSLNHEALLSSFPPVPGPRPAPGHDDREEALRDDADRGGSGRSTRGLSIASEGLSAFDFQFGGGGEEDVPPVPALDQKGRV